MSLMSVVFRILNKAGTDFIEPRSETGHGSAANKPTHTQAVLNEAQFQELKDSLSSLVIEGFALAENQLPDGHNVAVSNLSTIENILLEVTTPLDTQPVSADTLPLPTGAATDAKQLPDNHQVTVSNQIQQPTRPTDTQPISVGELPLPAGAATEDKQLPNNHDVSVSNFPLVQSVDITESTIVPSHITTATAGETVVVTPASGKAIRLWWYSLTANADNSNTVVAGLRFGSGNTDFFKQSLSKYGQGTAHSFKAGACYHQGGVNQPLIVNLDSSQTVYVNIDYEEVTP